MVRISDILRDEDLIRKGKGDMKEDKDKLAFSEALTAEDIMGDRVSPNLRAPTDREKKDALLLLEKLREALDKLFTSIRKEEGLDIAPLESLVEQFIISLNKYENIYMMQAYGDYDKNDLTYHSMWTALIAIKIGKKLSIEVKRLKELFIAGLLHDVGLLHIPEEILRKERESFRSEMEEIKSHPEKGRMILEKLGESYNYLLEVGYQEHERVDGSGYPLGLKDNEIGLFPQIIGIADTYEAMTHNRPYRVRKLPLYVIKEIVETMKEKFNPKILKALLEAITLYPVGSFVRLNNNEVGRVIASMGGSHFRHVVQILYGPDGEKLFEPRTVNLMDAHLLYIVEPIDEREFGNK